MISCKVGKKGNYKAVYITEVYFYVFKNCAFVYTKMLRWYTIK